MTNIKQSILKLKNKKLKGNISLLIILILLASSVIALLAINQIQNLMTYWNMTYNYFRAHYIAKAWLELWLTEVYNREDWFSTSINSWDSINTGNFVWWFNGLSDHLDEWESLTWYSWFEPYFTMTITGSFNYLTNDITNSNNCTDDNKIVLWTGEWLVIALFTDTTEWSINKIINSKTWDSSVLNNVKNLTMEGRVWKNEYTFWFFTFDNERNNTNVLVETWTDLSSFVDILDIDNKSYLTIRNSWDSTWSFCIGWDWLIPSSNSLITVQAHYWDMEVWLQSQVIKQTPFWALNSLWIEPDD